MRPQYPELEAEIARRGVKKKDIADQIGIGYKALSNKLTGKADFKMSEALAIHRGFFPDMDILVLFRISNTQGQKQKPEAEISPPAPGQIP